MNRAALIAFSARGEALAEKIARGLSQNGWDCRVAAARKESPRRIPGSLSEWTRAAFSAAQALIFVGAAGIAVRCVAPYLRGKDRDPAVVVVDDGGKFAVSLLSGHLGGANRLARKIARITGAVPVVTTATDSAGLFSVDEWAKGQNLAICTLKEAKAVSAALLDGRPVGFQSDFPVLGPMPRGLQYAENGPVGIRVSLRENRPFNATLLLVPRIAVLGIGCRRGIAAGDIAAAVRGALARSGISPRCIAGVCSVSLKRDEPGLAEFCRSRGLSLRFFSPEELGRVPGEFSGSPFVRRVTGVDNVCERSAALGSGGRLILKKQAENGVTVAAAAPEYHVVFDGEEPKE